MLVWLHGLAMILKGADRLSPLNVCYKHNPVENKKRSRCSDRLKPLRVAGYIVFVVRIYYTTKRDVCQIKEVFHECRGFRLRGVVRNPIVKARPGRAPGQA